MRDGLIGGGMDFGDELPGDEGGLPGDEGGLPGEEGNIETGGPETAAPENIEFGEGFRSQDKNIVDKLLVEGRRKNEDIMMMTEGIKKLIGEEDKEDEEEF